MAKEKLNIIKYCYTVLPILNNYFKCFKNTEEFTSSCPVEQKQYSNDSGNMVPKRIA